MLGIYIKDFEQNLIGSVYADQDQIFESIIFKYFKDDSIKMIKYIDIYDDTTLNHLMVKDLIIDIDHLLQRASGKECPLRQKGLAVLGGHAHRSVQPPGKHPLGQRPAIAGAAEEQDLHPQPSRWR